MIKSEQIPFDLNFRHANQREDFFVAESNFDAVSIIDRWPNWPSSAILIWGPKNSGKSHLCAVWEASSDALNINHNKLLTDFDTLIRGDKKNFIIDNLEQFFEQTKHHKEAEEHLFHLYNHVKNNNGSLLLTSTVPPKDMPITLKDLNSRLMACPQIQIHAPDDNLLAGLLVKLLNDQQLDIAPDALHYCVSHMERSFEAAFQLIRDLDYKSLSEKRRLTIPLIKSILDA